MRNTTRVTRVSNYIRNRATLCNSLFPLKLYVYVVALFLQLFSHYSGIETATMDLQKENEDRLWQEGILRHVPVVGSFVNWWSPKTKEGGVRGRSLNLTQGVVESTENIYR